MYRSKVGVVVAMVFLGVLCAREGRGQVPDPTVNCVHAGRNPPLNTTAGVCPKQYFLCWLNGTGQWTAAAYNCPGRTLFDTRSLKCRLNPTCP
ncbi:hypothetical protein ONE63_001209 [Megalurothrips usitatus]|uniref:Chitin-binding type-2 domain-containing protein n=1 Tax=Megalurothrips usitatus TaxID=439358 RepID=A0AAV7XBC4_9NEOP|nr:hypothetical protein ONE63_001209 [Megalurothrips usitatus]